MVRTPAYSAGHDGLVPGAGYGGGVERKRWPLEQERAVFGSGAARRLF